MNNTLLYSASEQATMRVNRQAQRQLDSVCRQLDQQRAYVGKDWNTRMKSFVAKSKKVLPNDWDQSRRWASARARQTEVSQNEIHHKTWSL